MWAEVYGGSGIDEVDAVGAPVSAVQLVFASIGAPGKRYTAINKRSEARQT